MYDFLFIYGYLIINICFWVLVLEKYSIIGKMYFDCKKCL